MTHLPPQDPDSWRRLLQPKYMLLAMMAVLILGSWLDKRYPELFQMSTWAERLGLSQPPPRSEGDRIGPAVVIDGDTIEVKGRRFNLAGIDAPEADQLCQRDGADYPCGEIATRALRNLLQDKGVFCLNLDVRNTGSMVGGCLSSDIGDLGVWMLEHGHAVADRDYMPEYAAAEDKARAARLGIWAGTFEHPQKYRERRR